MPLELNLALSALPLEVRSCRNSPIEVAPLCSICARVMMATGWLVTLAVCLMREPVTSTRSSVAGLAWSAGACGAAASWAAAAADSGPPPHPPP